MMFELCASTGCGISKEIVSKEIALFNWFCSISGKFKHHKKLENVNFEETNNAVFILIGRLNLRMAGKSLKRVGTISGINAIIDSRAG